MVTPAPHPDGHGRDAIGPDDHLADVAGLMDLPVRAPGEALTVLVPIVGPEARGPLAVWCLLLDADDRPLRPVVVVDDPPDPELVGRGFGGALMEDLAAALDEHALGGSVVVAIVGERRHRPVCTSTWVTALATGAAAAGVPLRGVVVVGPRGPRALAWHRGDG
ncbi:hypothetical protein KIN34_12710 [Cellulomonas sp. DKR-3]|uniref:N-acetyltransferase domain-containing protein n=1 Tax=Cellulomonas fulva TaxID=2835530 RepID=A0ABS5U160_9CELL|nr:hypothetical protein [Cellulomonas fulva]MBT0995143.1 hypothetical protein [Cellulomonas fulva]